MKKIFSEILSIIKPTKEEVGKEERFAKLAIQQLSEFAEPVCKITIAGSVAKKTFLRGNKECDVFVLFPLDVKKDDLEGKLINLVQKAFPGIGYQISYAEHPYIRLHIEGHRIDLVPAYKISTSSQRLSAVDRTILHTRFVKNNIGSERVDSILLLKAFLKANELYGAEIKIEGFSGYLCELLIIHYRSFQRLIREAAKWGPQIIIDIKRNYLPSEKKDLPKKFGFFIVIDPTDKNRNVAAAVSKQNFERFKLLCRQFIKNPQKKFFLKKPQIFEQKLEKIKKKGYVFLITMPRPEIVDDVLWGQLKRLIGRLEKALGEFEPTATLADDSQHLVRIAIALKKDKTSRKFILNGPPLSMEKQVINFKRSHSKAKFIIRNKKIYAEIKRVPERLEEKIKKFFKEFELMRTHLSYSEEIILMEKQGKNKK